MSQIGRPIFPAVSTIFALSLSEAVFASLCVGCENSCGLWKSENWTTFDGFTMAYILAISALSLGVRLRSLCRAPPRAACWCRLFDSVGTGIPPGRFLLGHD